jgi:excisionase family DNA binding protein
MLGGINIKALQRMARNKEIPAHKIGRYWFFRTSELDQWLQESCRVNEPALDSTNRPCLVI